MTDTSDNSLRPVLPFLTMDLPGIGGRIKTTIEDFEVEEIGQYELCGNGTHVYAFVQKTNTTTTDMIARIAEAAGVAKRDVGFAGRKDAKAITRQWISIEHIAPEKLRGFSTNNIRVLDVTRHGNKLKMGHLAGNRFTIRLRHLNRPADEALAIASQIMDVLSTKGVPNYFGPQRFGYRYDSHLLGAAIVKHDLKDFYDTLLGKPELNTQEDFIEARTLYEQGDLEGAYQAWHPAFHDHRKAIKNLTKFKGDRKKAFRRVDRHMLSLFVAAWQSDLFNRVLAARMPKIDTLYDGDMAYKHVNGACFQVTDAAAEQPRCGAFEISATGPLIGRKMKPVTGSAGAIENPLVEEVHLTADDMPRLKKYGGVGGRRPLRFQPTNHSLDTGTDDNGDFLELKFDLPSGCYATVLLREMMKTDV
ncbi:MAG: tRNA pseudouridine(13) synthase TruD [Planctomycetota bacterium]|jgi:tRNA pseudouridine13 synthase